MEFSPEDESRDLRNYAFSVKVKDEIRNFSVQTQGEFLKILRASLGEENTVRQERIVPGISRNLRFSLTLEVPQKN